MFALTPQPYLLERKFLTHVTCTFFKQETPCKAMGRYICGYDYSTHVRINVSHKIVVAAIPPMPTT